MFTKMDLGFSSFKMNIPLHSPTNPFLERIYPPLHMRRKWWLFCMQYRSGGHTSYEILATPRLITGVWNISWNNGSHPQHNKNVLANLGVMTMRSITRMLRKILWWILFPTHLIPMSLFQLLLFLFQIGYTLFNKAMSMTPHYLKSSNCWLVTLLWYHISLGMALLWDTRVVWCFPRAKILKMQSFMNSMLLHR